MPQHYRHFWGPRRTQTLNFQWDIITKSSFVLVTACEGRGGDNGSNPPNRFIGLAKFTVGSVAPHDGGVTFLVNIGLYNYMRGEGLGYHPWPDALELWTDITVFDATDFSGPN